MLLIQYSLTEEAIVEVIGIQSSQDLWITLERAYNHHPIERTQNLRDAPSIKERHSICFRLYKKKFKSLYNHLATIAQHVNNVDKIY